MPNFATSLALVETATKCRATAASSPETGEQPVTRGMGVGQRFERGEGLRRDDEQGLRRIKIAVGFDEIGAVDVGNEAESQIGSL